MYSIILKDNSVDAVIVGDLIGKTLARIPHCHGDTFMVLTDDGKNMATVVRCGNILQIDIHAMP